MVAEGVGFEPTIRFPVYTLSKRAPSATRPPLPKGIWAQYTGGASSYNPRKKHRDIRISRSETSVRRPRNFHPPAPLFSRRNEATQEEVMGRGLLLWLIGIPLPIILLIWVLGGLHG